MKELRPDLVVTYTIKPNIWGAFAAARTGVRSVAIVTGLGFAFTETGGARQAASPVRQFKTALVRRVARWLCRVSTGRNALLIFQNPDDRDDFISAGCLTDRGKVRVVNGSGVDLARFQPAPLPDAPYFLMISRILGAKGVREYARAAVEVKRTHPTARFRLVGFFDKGPDAISTSEVDGWVAQGLEYLGPSDDVRPHLADARIYVLPSYREGTPRSVLEAMAVGRAILTSDAPGCRETVVDGVNGFLIPVRDAGTLADKMRWMIENPEGCELMAKESLRIVREKYDVDKVNEVLIHHLGLDL
jgi:glycosyltransferase involved in cell wall biosynthesis